jgi:hypothetical protein
MEKLGESGRDKSSGSKPLSYSQRPGRNVGIAGLQGWVSSLVSYRVTIPSLHTCRAEVCRVDLELPSSLPLSQWGCVSKLH